MSGLVFNVEAQIKSLINKYRKQPCVDVDAETVAVLSQPQTDPQQRDNLVSDLVRAHKWLLKECRVLANGKRDEADDMAQATWVGVLRTIFTGQKISYFHGLLFTQLKYTLYRYLRNKARPVHTVPLEIDGEQGPRPNPNLPPGRTIDDDLRPRQVRFVLSLLTDYERYLVLAFEARWSAREIRERMPEAFPQVSESTVWRHRTEAVEKFRHLCIEHGLWNERKRKET